MTPSPWSRTRPVELQERIDAMDLVLSDIERAEIKVMESTADYCMTVADVIEKLEAQIRGTR